MKLTKHAILSRIRAEAVDKALVICRPGKPIGAVECPGSIANAKSHGIEVLPETPASCCRRQ